MHSLSVLFENQAEHQHCHYCKWIAVHATNHPFRMKMLKMVTFYELAQRKPILENVFERSQYFYATTRECGKVREKNGAYYRINQINWFYQSRKIQNSNRSDLSARYCLLNLITFWINELFSMCVCVCAHKTLHFRAFKLAQCSQPIWTDSR